jgi:hypothetical protein
VLGWLADLFRLYTGLIYWNLRKSWFQLRRGRAACPCQSPSDSGRAFETGCEACVQWHRPARFRRVCPLLVETKDGLRCSANTPEVRPFWGRAAGYYGGTLLGIYAAGVLCVFVFLRAVGYPVSVLDVGLPPRWHRLSHARAWYFFEQSRRAFAANHSAEGLLYLANAYEFDPSNYQIGITLAKNYQVGQPAQSDRVFAQLMRDHPAQRDPTAWDWHRALLARGNFPRIAALARDEIVVDPAHGHAWMRALLFATRQTGDVTPLQELWADRSPAVTRWRQVIETELLVRRGRTAEARAALVRPWPADAPPYSIVYRVNALTGLHDTLAALDLLEANRATLRDDEAYVTLRLDALAAGGVKNEWRAMVDRVLTQRDLASIKILCAHLIRYPDAATFARLAEKVDREQVRLDADSAGIWFSLLCTAGAVGDQVRLHALTDKLKAASQSPFLALVGVEAFFLGRTAERRITTILPILPLPTEVAYALLERYPSEPPPAAAQPALTTSPAKK